MLEIWILITRDVWIEFYLEIIAMYRLLLCDLVW